MVPVLMLGMCREGKIRLWCSPALGSSWQAQLWFWFLCWHLLYFLLAGGFTLIGAATFPRSLAGHRVPSSRSVLRGLCYQEFCEFSATLVTSAALHRAAAVPRTLSCPPSCLLGAVPGTAPAFPKNVLRHCLGKCCLAQARSCGWLTNRLG